MTDAESRFFCGRVTFGATWYAGISLPTFDRPRFSVVASAPLRTGGRFDRSVSPFPLTVFPHGPQTVIRREAVSARRRQPVTSGAESESCRWTPPQILVGGFNAAWTIRSHTCRDLRGEIRIPWHRCRSSSIACFSWRNVSCPSCPCVVDPWVSGSHALKPDIFSRRDVSINIHACIESPALSPAD